MNSGKEEPTDEALVEEAKGGSDAAFRELVSRYKNYVFSLVGKQVRSRELAEELSQDIFVKAYRGLSRYRSESSFKTWLTRITLNATNSYFRSKRFSKEKVTISQEEEGVLEQGASDHDPVQQEQVLLIFKGCFGKMKAQMQEVITLCGYQEQSYEEAAEVLEVPVGTIRSRLNRARLTLKECMQRQGVVL